MYIAHNTDHPLLCCVFCLTSLINLEIKNGNKTDSELRV